MDRGILLVAYVIGHCIAAISGQSSKCGQPRFGKSNLMRIVGGNKSGHGEWPWQVWLKYNGNHLCGGSLIKRQWVLTAAHCFNGMKTVKGLTLVLGDYRKAVPDRSEIALGAEMAVLHRGYNSYNFMNDIALVKLRAPIDSTAYIQPICLPQKYSSFEGELCTVTGWGVLRSGGTIANTLHEVTIPIRKKTECQRMMKWGYQSSTNLCAGRVIGGKDACQGDSGGPLVCKSKKGWQLAGIVSWGYGCALPGHAGVYTKVSAYLNWIESVIKKYR